MANCEYCNEPVSLPYTCSLCGNKYDGKHRLPESHQCINLDKFQTKEYLDAKRSKTKEAVKAKTGSYSSGSSFSSGYGRSSLAQNFWQASTPAKTVILAGITLGLAINFYQILSFVGDTTFQDFMVYFIGVMLFTAIGLYTMFYFRKKVADNLDVQTTFLFWPLGVLITFITAIIPFFFTLLLFGYFTNLGDYKNSTEIIKVSNYAYFGTFAGFRVLGYVGFNLLNTVLPVTLFFAFISASTALIFYGGLMMIPWGRLDGAIFYNSDRNTYFVHLALFLIIIILLIIGLI